LVELTLSNNSSQMLPTDEPIQPLVVVRFLGKCEDCFLIEITEVLGIASVWPGFRRKGFRQAY